MSVKKSLWLLTGAMFVGMLITAVIDTLCSIALADVGKKIQFAVASVFQNGFAFVLPAIIVVRMGEANCWESLRTHRAPRWVDVIAVLLMAAVSLPAMNWLVEWNVGLHLPQSLAVVEEALRKMEDTALAQTDMVLHGNSLGMMLLMVLCVGIITGHWARSSSLGEACNRF